MNIAIIWTTKQRYEQFRNWRQQIKAVILAGGLGTRISEESHLRPKPMIEIGGKPIIWHIMKIYSHFGVKDFVICCGYKSYVIKEYFSNYFLHNSDVTFDLVNNHMEVHHKNVEPWKVTIVDTGENTQTGGRLKQVRKYLDDGPFSFTYGDGVADINIRELLKFHMSHGKLATVTAVRPPARWGAMHVEGTSVTRFLEKPANSESWINGGFFILSPKVIDYIDNDLTSWECEPMIRLAEKYQLEAFKHDGFWQPMDTLREKKLLEDSWHSGRAPWKVWD